MNHRIFPYEDGFVVKTFFKTRWEINSDKVFRYETAETILELRKKGVQWDWPRKWWN